ncbi:unnamed protein product [Rotaria sordida]|uniref:Condensin complex subunit 1 C-terminal domain-containing protein n=1 Tax=Rotaria sordida TaxID=392033 RepID=A0A816AI43_9BILA|nr:unnamed protein product [Rotaria sordida]CAF1597922.1 unnamed protein product [Rotaria sordida]
MDFENAGNENNQNQLSQHQQQHHHHHSQMNANSALLLVRFLNCLGKAAVGIAYYVDCTVKDKLLRRKEAKLMQYKNIVEQILLHQNEYYEETLQLSATICFCKFMLLSVKLCEKHAKILFDLLKYSTFESVQVGILVLMNDFYLKYPSSFDAYSNGVYNCLHNPLYNVRLVALKTISDLILKEMMKLKDQISEIALCIIDKHPQIATLATSFFSELAKRQHGQALFNILPDIFSNLVAGKLDEQRQLNEEDFKSIIKFLFQYISYGDNPHLWCDLAYIMSKLKFNERTLKCLHDHYNYYADKLVEDAVYESFLTILNNAKQNLGTKPDLKVVFDELSTRIEHARSSNGILIAVQQAQQKTKQQSKVARASGAKKGKQTKSRSKAKAKQSDDDLKENDGDDDDDENEFKRPMRKEPKVQTISRSKRGADA